MVVLSDLVEQYNGRCVYCATEVARFPEDYTPDDDAFVNESGKPSAERDHITPRAHGGTDALENIVLACAPCNRDKATQPVEAWLLGFIGEAR